MKPGIFIAFCAIIFFLNTACSRQQAGTVTIDTHVLKDKIAGGWAGKMLGVSYGGPTEFVAHGFILEDTISWTPSKVHFSLMEDDIYVQLTFMMTMDQYGEEALQRNSMKCLPNPDTNSGMPTFRPERTISTAYSRLCQGIPTIIPMPTTLIFR